MQAKHSVAMAWVGVFSGISLEKVNTILSIAAFTLSIIISIRALMHRKKRKK